MSAEPVDRELAGPYRAHVSRVDVSAEVAPRRASPWGASSDERAGLGLGPVAAIAAACVAWGLFQARGADTSLHFNFLEDATPHAIGFSTPVAAAGEWALEEHAHATGGRALVNRVGDEGARPAVAVLDAFTGTDVHAETRCKFMPDHPERACGLVFGYRDPAHYHVARLDGGGVTLVEIAGGIETKLAEANAEVTAGVWHDLTVVARAEAVVVSWNGREVLSVRDERLRDEGAVGLWAPANGHVWFDVLAVEAPGRSRPSG